MKTEDIEKAAINYDSRLVAFRAFMEGAKWRINTVWHDRTEPAEEGNDIILLFPDGKCTVMTLNGEWELIIAWLLFYKWAYLKDILPDNFVKTK